MKKILLKICCFALIFQLLVIVVSAHSGRTDSSGGHYDHSSGEYHYHHGYSAHQHYDMDGDGDRDCPYTFDDKTNHNSSSNSSNNKTDNNSSESNRETTKSKNRLTVGIIFKILGISLLFLILASAFVLPLIYMLLDSLIAVITTKLFKTEHKDSISLVISIIIVVVSVVTIVSIVVLKNENII